MRLPVALFNFQDGGQQPDGTYDFGLLQHAFSAAEPPDLIVLCEAKRYIDDGGRRLHEAAAALRAKLSLPYVGLLGSCDRGPWPPAVFYNPCMLQLQRWWENGSSRPLDAQNVAEFDVNGTPLNVLAHHWTNVSPRHRVEEARRVDRWAEHRQPVLLGGDLNGTASGPHLPQRNWAEASYRARTHKARRRVGLNGGDVWVADTEAVDHLIGRWDLQLGRRGEGCGFHAVAELAAASGTPPADAYRATVADGVDAGGGLLIDWLLANDALAGRYIAGSYRVHVAEGQRRPSDHRLVTAAFEF
jgi:endonuclease/exonuclease/phosphatase family metal-dependent hydrolase